MVRAAWMEKIMSKTKYTTTPATLGDDHRPLADSELDAVSGGSGRTTDRPEIQEITVWKYLDKATP